MSVHDSVVGAGDYNSRLVAKWSRQSDEWAKMSEAELSPDLCEKSLMFIHSFIFYSQVNQFWWMFS